MTLAEFLLARIAEEENEALGRQRDHADLAPHDWGDQHGAPSPERALVDLTARRNIIGRYDEAARNVSRGGIHVGMYVALGECLIDLAARYADHPDYREEWRP